MNVKQITLIALTVIALAVISMAGCPYYSVYSSRMDGKAQLAHATYSKEVAVATARAKMESAAYEAQADTIRAHGVARSNAIIGESLRNNQAYLYWLWIDHIEKANVIYVPTEANMPLLEAGGRFSGVQKPLPAPQQ